MTKDMTQGSPLKLILAFAVPLMLGSLFQQFYNLADTIIVGRFVGVDALAAVGSVGGLNYLVLGFVNGIACGFSIPISWTFGAKDYREMRRYTANTVWLSLFFAVVLTVVTVALTRAVLVWTNTPDNIIDIADIYIRTIFWGIPFTLLYNVTSALMRALGDSKRPLYFLLVASVLNIGLDLLCILIFRMGAFGAAFATVFSQAVAGIGSLIYIGRHYPELKWSREEGRLSASHCLKLCNMGIPMGLQCSITAIGSVVLQGAVNGLGSSIVAAQTAGSKAAQFLSVPLESIGTAMTTYASQNMGAHDLKRVDRGVNTALGIGCVYSVASFLILRVLDVPLISLFLESSEVEIMANARSFIFWNSVFYIPLAVLIVLWQVIKIDTRTAVFVSMVVAVLCSFLTRSAILSPRLVADGLQGGAGSSIGVAVACAMAGIISGVVSMTALGTTLVAVIVPLAQKSIFLALFCTMLACIVLGMGVPTTANYVIMATITAPILIKMGIPLLAAHMFVFYFGIVADITPPVALAAYAGSAIAHSNPLKTGITATKLAIGAFIIPYIFALNPSLLFIDVESVWALIGIMVTSIIGMAGIAMGMTGHVYAHVPWYMRIMLLAGGIFLIDPSPVSDFIGLLLIGIPFAFQLLQNRKLKATAAE